MFFKKQKAQKERKAKEKRLSMLMTLTDELQNLFSDYLWYRWVDADSFIRAINTKLKNIEKRFPEYDAILDCKGFLDTELPYDKRVAFIQLKRGQDDQLYAFCTSEKTITVAELQQNKEEFNNKFGPAYDIWYMDKANVEMANIHWPWYTYLVHLHKVEIPRMKAAVEKLVRKNELEIFYLKRELGYPGYGD